MRKRRKKRKQGAPQAEASARGPAAETRPGPEGDGTEAHRASGPEDAPRAAAETTEDRKTAASTPEMRGGPSAPDEAHVERAGADSGSGGPGAGLGPAEAAALAERARLFEERLKRALADMANMRRRQVEERRRVEEAAVEKICKEFLPVLDAFELALASRGGRDELLEGLRMVHTMLEDLLARHGVQAIPAEGLPFDPAVHEATATEERTDVPPGTVTQVQQKGFKIGDRVLRAARVVVSANPPPGENGDGGAAPGGSGDSPRNAGGGEGPEEGPAQGPPTAGNPSENDHGRRGDADL